MRILPIFLLSIASLFGQAPSADKESLPRERRSRRPPPVISPEIADGREVTFRLKASTRTEVLLRGQWSKEPIKMAIDEKDIWSVTIGPIEAGVWEYSFQVDNLAMLDPGNSAIKPMRSRRTSILHLPGKPPLIHDFQEVPHGTDHTHTYQSKSLGSLRELAVYTPPGYAKHPNKASPTMYLQHGRGDSHATWTVHGKAQWILDNLIAQGKVVPMVIVMMNGHTARTRDKNTESFERDLLEDVLPFVEASYRVKPEATSRCIVGLSMGGGQSLTIGLNYTDSFGWVGGFSSSVPREKTVATALENVRTTDNYFKMLWITCGEADFFLERNKEFIALLTEKKVLHQRLLTDGEHSWPIWRHYLSESAPPLFQ